MYLVLAKENDYLEKIFLVEIFGNFYTKNREALSYV